MNYCYKDYSNGGGTVEPPPVDPPPISSEWQYFFRGAGAQYHKGWYHYFSNNGAYYYHTGIDICVPFWTPIYSVCSGTVIRTSNEGGYSHGILRMH